MVCVNIKVGTIITAFSIQNYRKDPGIEPFLKYGYFPKYIESPELSHFAAASRGQIFQFLQ